MPTLSVITVVKDAETDFTETLRSVQVQQGSRFEYVVVDSSSNREAISSLVQDLSIEYFWVAPGGIYSAMNFGLECAEGDYVYFLNAGDTLVGDSVLEEVSNTLRKYQPTWMYADVLMTDPSGRKVEIPDWDYREERLHLFSRGHFPCHQGTFVKRSVLSELGGFDTRFEVAADYEAFLRLSAIDDPIKLNVVVADFKLGGQSSKKWLQGIVEFHRARRTVFTPTGMDSLRELRNSVALLAKTMLYRGLFAPGKPGHAMAQRISSRRRRLVINSQTSREP